MIANRMLIIHKGKKIIEGDVASLLDPADTIVHIQSADIIWLRQKLADMNIEVVNGSDESIKVRVSKANIPKLISDLSSSGIALTGIHARHSLEDYFISLTNENN